MPELSCRSGRAEEDSGHDEISREGVAVSLEKHTADVREDAVRFVQDLAPDFVQMFGTVADFHDAGKADFRFQAMLHGGDRMAADYSPQLLAKGAVLPGMSFREAKDRSGLPADFRHELASLHFAKQGCGSRPDLELDPAPDCQPPWILPPVRACCPRSGPPGYTVGRTHDL